MRRPRRLALSLAAIALAAPATAVAQGDAPPLQTNPPVSPGQTNPAQRAGPASPLPATGAEPGLLALAGAGLLMTGLGLRIRLREPLA